MIQSIVNAATKWSGEISIAKKIFIILSLPLLVNVLLAVLFLNLQANWESADKLLLHSKEILLRSESFYRSVLEAQVNLRGYVFLDNKDYKTRMDASVEKLKGDLQDLQHLVLDSQEQTKLLDSVALEVEDFSGSLDVISQNMADRKVSAAMEIVRDLSVEKKVDKLQKLLADFTDREEQLDQKRKQILQETYRNSLRAVAIGCFTLLALTGAIAIVFNASISQRFKTLVRSIQDAFTGGSLEPKVSGNDEIAQLETAFLVVSKTLSERSAENEAFMYSVSHDMRSPLVNIQGFSEELKLSLADLERHAESLVEGPTKQAITQTINNDLLRAANFIAAATGRLSSIIDSLLKISRIGKVEYQFQVCDVHAIVSKIVAALQNSIDEQGATVQLDRLPSVYADPSAIDQIFSNIIGNAVKYLDKSRVGSIKIGVRWDLSTADFYAFYVQDNGKGFPEVFAKKLFLPFQRYHVDVKGEGIGLALVHRIIERMKGSITTESIPNQGSTFIIMLPTVQIKSEFVGSSANLK